MTNNVKVENTLPFSKMVLRILSTLDVFALGGAIAMFIVNRLLVAQVEVYNPDYIVAASAIIAFLDDIAPYLAIYISSVFLLTFAIICTWLWTKFQSRLPRYGVALLVLIFVAMLLWMFMGRSSGVTSTPMITPTPM